MVVYDGKWVSILKTVPRSPSRKTGVYEVVTKETRSVIATIHWYVPWRKYALFPREETVWETTCLHEIVVFLDELMEERKKNSAPLLPALHTPRELRRLYAGVAGAQRVEHGPPKPDC